MFKKFSALVAEFATAEAVQLHSEDAVLERLAAEVEKAEAWLRLTVAAVKAEEWDRRPADPATAKQAADAAEAVERARMAYAEQKDLYAAFPA